MLFGTLFFTLFAFVLNLVLGENFEVLIGLRKQDGTTYIAHDGKTVPLPIGPKPFMRTVKKGQEPYIWDFGHTWITIRKRNETDIELHKEFHLTMQGLKMYDPREGTLEYYNLDGEHRKKPIPRRPGEEVSGKTLESHFKPRVYTRDLSIRKLFGIATDLAAGRAAAEFVSDFMCHHFVIQFVLKIVDEGVAERLRESRHRWPKCINWLEEYYVTKTERSAFTDSGVGKVVEAKKNEGNPIFHLIIIVLIAYFVYQALFPATTTQNNTNINLGFLALETLEL